MTIFVGITGSYASGKTFMLDYLAGKGYPTFSADRCIKELYANISVQNQILEFLPELKIFERQRIANLIYEDDVARMKLQNFIHPIVVNALQDFKQQHSTTEIIFAEIPLLFEAGFEQYFDYIVTVFCSERTRKKRAKMRGFFDLAIYNKIKQIQLPQEVKMTKAHSAVNADNNMIEWEREIDQIIKILKCNTSEK